MKKLKTILNESLSFQQNKVYSNPFAKAFVSEIENDENGNSLSIEEKKQFLESVKMYRELGERIGYRGNLAEVHKMLKSIVEMASRVTIDETEDWFDRVTVNRHIKALNEAFKLFTKTVQEIYPLQQRLESTYDEMGEVLSKYYEIKNIDINNLTTESKNMKFTQLVEQEKEYKEFFKSALKKFGIKSPADLDTEKKKEFFTYVDDNWKSKNERVVKSNISERRVKFAGKTVNDLYKLVKNNPGALIFSNGKLYSIENIKDMQSNLKSDVTYGYMDNGGEREIKIKDIEFIELKESVNEAKNLKKAKQALIDFNLNKLNQDEMVKAVIKSLGFKFDEFSEDEAGTELGRLIKHGKIPTDDYVLNNVIDTLSESVNEAVKFKRGDNVHIKSKNISGIVFDISGKTAAVHTRNGLIKVNVSDLEQIMNVENITEGDFAGWVAIFNGKRIEIDKSEAKDLWGAKQLAIKRLNVPKSKVGLLAIKPGYNENTVHMNEGVVKKLGKYTFDSRDYPQVKYNGEVITTGEFDEDGYWFDIPGKRGSTWFDSAEDVLNYLSKNKITFESVMNEIKSGSIVIPYAHNRYGEFIVDKVFKNKDGETSYTGKFKKSGENREFILHSKDKIIKENTNMKLTNLLKENFGMGELPSSKLMKMKQSLSEIMAESDSKADLLRTNMPGYVGPKFAKKASDDDLLKMADLKDKLAKLHNQHTKPVEDEIAKLQKKYNIKESVNENKKKIKINPPIGNAKYSISYYDGKKTHKDGSPFYDIKIFKSKDELNTAIGDFKKQGYIEESVNENKSDAMYDLAAQVYDLVDYKDLKNKNKIKAALAKLKKPTDPLTIGMVMRKMQDVIGENTINEGKFSVDDLVYNKRTKTVGIVRIGDDKYGEVKTDADGNVSVDELEKYNPIKFKHQSKAKVAPSTEKEINSRGLFNPFKSESVNESKVHFEKKLKNGNIFQVIDRDTAGMRGTQDKFHMQIVDKTGKVVKDVGSHPSLDGAKKFSNKFESVNEYNVNKKFGPKYDIGAGSLGSGTTFWNRAEEEFGDYKKIAHVSDNGKITFYDKKLPNDIKSHIQKYADMQTESVNPMSLTSLISKNKK